MATADPSPLRLGPMHWFSEWPVGDVPQAGSLVYTIWDRSGVFVYVGIPNVTINSRMVSVYTTSPYAGWSHDQFVMDMCDEFVRYHLGLGERLLEVAYASHPLYKSADHTVRDLGFRWLAMDDPKAAFALARALEAGEHNPPGRPLLSRLGAPTITGQPPP